MNKRHKILAIAFMLVAALLMFGDDKPPTEATDSQATHNEGPSEEPSDRAAPVSAKKIPVAQQVMGLRSRASSAQVTPLMVPEDEIPKLFAAQNWNPPPPKVAIAPPPPPTAPPLPFVYVGKKWEADTWEVFLSNGSDIRVARKNDVIDGIYLVSDILPPTLTLTYLPLNKVQLLNIGALN